MWEAQDQAKAEQERKARILAPLRAAQMRRSIATVYGGGEEGEKLAWFTTGVEFDLPESEWVPPPKPPATEPVKPGPTESHLVQP